MAAQLSCRRNAGADLAAEKEILRHQATVRAAPADDLRRLQERLAAGDGGGAAS